MSIKDRIYGQKEIREEVLLDLINSKELQRLKGVAQYGIPKEYYPSIPGFSRYEHSVGVMVFLKDFGASLEEQVAGLIHDVSHTAFSHVIDLVLGQGINEEYQDNNHYSFLAHSSIKDILEKYNFSLERISDFRNFTILDREIPFLCADRIDYAFREFKLWAAPDIVDECLEGLLIRENRLVFNNIDPALKFAKNYLKCQIDHWADYEAVARYYILSEILKEGLEKGIVSRKDFLEEDSFVLAKIYSSKDQNLINQLDELKAERLSRTLGVKRKKKFRYVDPEVLIGKEVKRSSFISKDFAALLKKQAIINKAGIMI